MHIQCCCNGTHQTEARGVLRTVLTTMSDVRDRCRKLTWNLPMLLSWST